MIESLAVVATAASTTLVAAMATDAWGAARTGMLRVLRRGNEDEQAGLAAQLDGEAALVGAADDPDTARRTLRPAWQLRLEQFLRDHPEVIDDVRELTERLKGELPRSEQPWVQHIEARDHAQAFGVQHGDVIIHQEPGSGRGGPVT
ncbi:hypothetical protein ACFRMN_35390 [Streptomyces sp. NPDC056835]|uniref:hypothetical protein n=1 Tax=Streptomyces sp. NPDC056835 TaxID=3345956 RepID=UPI0036CC6D3A